MILFFGINGLIDVLSVQLKFLMKEIAHTLHAKTVPSRHICYIHQYTVGFGKIKLSGKGLEKLCAKEIT